MPFPHNQTPAPVLTPAQQAARRAHGKIKTPIKLSPSTQSKVDVVPAYRHEALLKLHSKALNLSRPKRKYTDQRLAPFTELQKLAQRQAKKIITDQERDNLHGEARTQLQNANRQNILNAVQPYLNQEVNPLTARAEYLNPYQNNMIQTLREESQQHLLEDILPRVNASYIRGFHSSGRNKLTQKAIADSQKSLQREISKLLSHGHEKASELGLEHARIKAQETQGRGTLASQAASRQKESDIIGAREMQNLSQIQQSQQHENARSLNQLGSEVQRQEQAKLNIPYQEYIEEREAPYLHLARQAGIVNSLPQPGFQTLSTTPPVVDIPPNLYSAGAGGMGVFADLMHPKRARGGRVTKRAAGGAVHMPAPDTSQMQAMAQQFQQPSRDPRWGYLGAMGGTMLANLHMNPLRAFGHGALAGREAMNAEYHEEDQRAVHAANLIDKINSTRQAQQELLQRYEIAKEGNVLTRRGQDLQDKYHMGILDKEKAKTEKKHQPIVIEGKPYNVMQDPNTGETLLDPAKVIGAEGEKEEIVSKDRQKRIDESWEKIRGYQNYFDAAKKVENYAGEVDSGPVSGFISHIPAIGPYAAGLINSSKPENIAGLDTASKQLAVIGRESKGRSILELQSTLASKPGPERDKFTNISGTTQAETAALNDLKHELEKQERIGKPEDKEEVKNIKKYYLEKYGIDLNIHERKTFEEIKDITHEKIHANGQNKHKHKPKNVSIPKALKRMSQAEFDQLDRETPR